MTVWKVKGTLFRPKDIRLKRNKPWWYVKAVSSPWLSSISIFTSSPSSRPESWTFSRVPLGWYISPCVVSDSNRGSWPRPVFDNKHRIAESPLFLEQRRWVTPTSSAQVQWHLSKGVSKCPSFQTGGRKKGLVNHWLDWKRIGRFALDPMFGSFDRPQVTVPHVLEYLQ